MGGALDEIRPEATVNAVLELAFRTLDSVLFYCFVSMLALLGFIGFLLKVRP